MAKLNFQHRLLQSSVSYHPSGIISVCLFGGQETFLVVHFQVRCVICFIEMHLFEIYIFVALYISLLSHVILLSTNFWTVTFIKFIRENECPLMVFCRMCFSSVSLWWAQHRLKTSEPRWVLMGGLVLVLIEYKHSHTSISLQTKSSSNQQHSHTQ